MRIPPHGTEGDIIYKEYPPWGLLSLGILPFAAKLGLNAKQSADFEEILIMS